MKWILAAGFVFGKPIYRPDASLADKTKVMAPFFNPAPGSIIAIDHKEKINRPEELPLPIRGYILVSPPKNHCFIIQRGPRLADQNVCQKTSIPFTLEELDEAGKINWLVTTQKNEPPLLLSWPTPHRVGTLVGEGRWKDQDYQDIILSRCAVEKGPDKRDIRVTLMNGEEFVVQFPLKDTLLPQPPPIPNLIMPEEDPIAVIPKKKTQNDHGEKKDDGHGDSHGKAEPPPPPPKKRDEFREEPGTPGKKWFLKPRDTFVMPSSAIRKEGSPAGIQGECRYRLKNAPGDPQSGIVECYTTETYDYLRLVIPCTRDL